MGIEENKNLEQKVSNVQPKKKSLKKFFKILLGILILALLVGGGVFAYKKYQLRKSQTQQARNLAPKDTIERYKQDLQDLKAKAASNNAEDLQNYGIAQYATGDAQGAIDTYSKQIAKDPNSVIAHSGLANALRDQKNYDKAIEEYNKAIELNPSNVSAYVNLASVYQYQLNQKDKALEIYQQGIEKNPKSADLLALKGLAYEQMEKTDEAKRAYQEALKIDENNSTAKTALDRLNQ